ncbi:metal ABC transporter solute-binding protein, Zn/Mn family [Pontibacillus sp. ALD_SL1]|uniref:metal ABC transporter solute-binding protein, Zn/Mn family n=1 Tax=Pontibacillus sp. ALD_SL1 TaxID=2777185 RepID=UPI001F60F3BF|nr:zinc ABC transporter substrate-binding protein [Pontibacillus sp. ALD_SL1]
MKKLITSLAMASVLLIASACSSNNNNDSSIEDLTIYTSIYPIEYFTEEIGGETVDVESIYPPGADAHTFEPTAKTMAQLAESDAFFYLGAGLEGFAESAAESLNDESVSLVELGTHESLFAHVENKEEDHEEDHHEGHSHGDKDPHVWLDPVRAKEMASYIKEELIELNPEEKELYKENFNKLSQDLTALHEDFQSVVEKADHNKFLVAHGAYGYWEERYGLEQISVNGISPSSEPSQKDIERLIQTGKKENIDYMVFEKNVSNEIATIVQEEIGAEALSIHNLSVRMREDIDAENDYFDLMRQNLDVLKTVLNHN